MPTDKTAKLYLSERNLRTLLSKLERDRAGEGTACSIIKHKNPDSPAYQQTMKTVMVIAVQDADFYGEQGRPAGEMHPADEAKMAAERHHRDLMAMTQAHMDALPILIEAVKRLPDASSVLYAWDQARTPK